MNLHNPPHPGEIIREDCLKPLNLTVKEAAEGLGSTPETWLAMQMQYDLWQAKQRAGKIKVRRFAARKAA